jgi:gamma-glutamylcyclotransferase (GGCT)/AIG2-like uncharacterized protein YtfP
MPDYLFVYGTLRKNYDLKLKNRVRDDLQYVGQAKVGASLYDLGRYPGAIKSNKGQEVIGDVFLVNEPVRVLKILDKYEGVADEGAKAAAKGTKAAARPEFVRKKSRVRLRSGKNINAWIYWYNFDPKDKRRIRYKDYLNYLKNKSTQKE